MSAPGYGVHPACFANSFASSAGCSPTGPAPTGARGSPPDCRASSICHREAVVAFDGSLLVMKGSRHDAFYKDGCEGGSEVVGRERMHQCADPCAIERGLKVGAEQRAAGGVNVVGFVVGDGRKRSLTVLQSVPSNANNAAVAVGHGQALNSLSHTHCSRSCTYLGLKRTAGA